MTFEPIVFISYSHDNENHKIWVKQLATDLQNNGINTIIDQWYVSLGSDLAMFMESSVKKADRVLVVCTPNYVKKANMGEGGVGYEKMIVTGQLIKDIKTDKFIPVIRCSEGKKAVPTFLESRLFIDFDEDGTYKEKLDALIREIHNEPASPKPPIGESPYKKK